MTDASRARWIRVAVPVSMAMIVAACGDPPSGPAPEKTGDISISAAASGLDPLDAYSVRLGNAAPVTVLVPSPPLLLRLEAGSYSVTVGAIPDNCTLDGENPRVVDIVAGSATSLELAFTCVARTGDAEVTISSAGLDWPNAYQLQVDDGKSMSVAANGAKVVTGLAGSRVFTLVVQAPNCAVQGSATRAVTMKTGSMTRDTVRVSFDVTCTAVSGFIEVGISTTGEDLDPYGYLLQLDGLGIRRQSSDVDWISVGGGTHVLTISGLRSNCTLVGSGGGTRTLTVTVGGTTRDTVRTTFAVTCVRTEKIAFTRWGAYGEASLMIGYADGTHFVKLAEGSSPSWSPDGTTIVFSRVICDDYYWYGCYSVGISTIRSDGSTSIRDLTHGTDTGPAWSPDGSKVAFVREGRVYVMNSDGTSPTRLAADSVKNQSEPAWSPSGTSIAFVCQVVTDWSDICAANANGTGFQRLTKDPWKDESPAWRPDGNRIAFATDRDTPDGVYGVATMNPDGSNVVRLTNGRQPAWSRDGARIVFVGTRVGSTTEFGLWVVNADGTGRLQLTIEAGDDEPSWRP